MAKEAARVFYVHWDEDQARAKIAEPLPQTLVISLERLPSHGHAIAEWFCGAKKRRRVPLVFAGGVADQVEAARKKFPEAIYCSNKALVETLNSTRKGKRG